MPNKKNVSRRHFLQSAGSLSGIAYLRLSGAGFAAIAQAACSAKHDSAAYLVLGDDEAADFAAIAARIIPTTDTPGATEAGVIHFFDQAFAGEMSDQLDAARAGLADFNAAIADTAAPAARFSALGTDEQDAFLHTQDSSDFFNLAWLMTIYGFFSMSRYGGNKNHIGWELIGFEGANGGWAYPFGHYDAGFVEEKSRGE